jgi:hypothetical protein
MKLFLFEIRGTNLLKQKGTNHYSLGDEKEHHKFCSG